MLNSLSSACYTGCLQCEAPTANSCQVWNATNITSPNPACTGCRTCNAAGACTGCPLGAFINGNDTVCTPCIMGCDKCSSPIDCDTCSVGQNLTTDGKCAPGKTYSVFYSSLTLAFSILIYKRNNYYKLDLCMRFSLRCL